MRLKLSSIHGCIQSSLYFDDDDGNLFCNNKCFYKLPRNVNLPLHFTKYCLCNIKTASDFSSVSSEHLAYLGISENAKFCSCGHSIFVNLFFLVILAGYHGKIKIKCKVAHYAW